ncbi:BatE [hydrothermal vent metagenome]|uniref:BatE n=1 Tax=hydrothermal vent metagenome TaxID=652676 RepID=A0A3B1D939_9ZZZZ
MRGVRLSIFLFLSMLSYFSVAFAQTPETLFSTASESYRKAQYIEAIEGYEAVLRNNRESGNLYYNLANSYFKDKQLGKAILNYERALRLLPRDSDVKFNYQYALKEAQVISGDKVDFIQKAVNGHIQFYTREEMVLVMMVLCVGLGLFFLMALYLQWPVHMRGGFCGILGFVLIIYLVGFYLKVQSEKNIAIMVLSTDAKFEPRTNATMHFSLPAGSKVRNIKTKNGWVKIQRRDGKLGWVLAESIERI